MRWGRHGNGGSAGIAVDIHSFGIPPFQVGGTRPGRSAGVPRPVGSLLRPDWPGGRVTSPWKRVILGPGCDVSAAATRGVLRLANSRAMRCAPAAEPQARLRLPSQPRHPNGRAAGPPHARVATLAGVCGGGLQLEVWRRLLAPNKRSRRRLCTDRPVAQLLKPKAQFDRLKSGLRKCAPPPPHPTTALIHLAVNFSPRPHRLVITEPADVSSPLCLLLFSPVSRADISAKASAGGGH